jgi:hypothetical protein
MVVPLSNQYQTSNNKGKPHTSFLLLTFEPENKIVRSSVAQYVPDPGKTKDISQRVFFNFYDTKVPAPDGRYVFLSITDRYLHEFSFKGGREANFRILTKKKQDAGTNS